MVILRVLVKRMAMIIIIMLIIRLSPSAQVSDDENESDGQGTVQGDAAFSNLSSLLRSNAGWTILCNGACWHFTGL